MKCDTCRHQAKGFEEIKVLQDIDILPLTDLNKKLIAFGNWLMTNHGSARFLTPSGLDNSYIRKPMADILKIYNQELLKLESRKHSITRIFKRN